MQAYFFYTDLKDEKLEVFGTDFASNTALEELLSMPKNADYVL